MRKTGEKRNTLAEGIANAAANKYARLGKLHNSALRRINEYRLLQTRGDIPVSQPHCVQYCTPAIFSLTALFYIVY